MDRATGIDIVDGTNTAVSKTMDGTKAVYQVDATGSGGDPADDTAAWMPLTTVTAGVPELVWDGDDNLIPTLVPI